MDKFVDKVRACARRTDLGLDLIRAYLGLALFIRGVMFVSRPDLVLRYLQHSGDWFWPVAIAHYVGFAHLGGGLLLAIGLVTRTAAAIQVPVLFGAVFMVHLREGLLWTGQSLELAALVLFLLLIFTVFGSGRLSADYVMEHGVRSSGTAGGPAA